MRDDEQIRALASNSAPRELGVESPLCCCCNATKNGSSNTGTSRKAAIKIDLQVQLKKVDFENTCSALMPCATQHCSSIWC